MSYRQTLRFGEMISFQSNQDISRLTDPEGWVTWTAVSIFQKWVLLQQGSLN